MISVIISFVVIIADQLSKFFVVEHLKPVGNIPIIKGILDFSYVENRGAAFGMLSDNRVIFMAASVAIIALLLYIIYKYRGQNKLFDISMGFILGGGVGNMIDRIRLGYVIDFVDFCAFDFWKWVFNIADSAVVVGCILAIICLILEQKTGKSIFNENTVKEDNGETNDE